MEEIMTDTRGSSSAAVMVGFLTGAVLGAGIALLMAPDSGEATRRRLGETARRLKTTASHRLEDLKHSLGDRGKEAMSVGREAYERGLHSPISREPV